MKRATSYLQVAMYCSIYYKQCISSPVEQQAIISAAKGAIYYVHLYHGNDGVFSCEDNMLFSHVKISCFTGILLVFTQQRSLLHICKSQRVTGNLSKAASYCKCTVNS